MMEVESSFSMRDQITAAALAKKKLLRRFSVGSVLSRSRTIRKLRKVFLVVLLHVYLTKRLAELRWGQFVESQDNLLLHTSRKEVPQHYLDGLGGCPLPPGWVASVLPAPLRNQILTYAKNKIVNLLTPVAKRRCYRSQILQLRQSMMQSATPVTDTMLKKASPMFEAAWTPAAIDDLMRCGTCVAYKQNMWVQQPTKSAYYPVNGMFLMSGTVVEVTLVPQEQTHNNHHHIHQTADGKTPLTLQTHRELTAPCMLCETRFVLQSTSRVGYFARTNVLVMEYPYRDLGHITAELLQSPQRDRLRKYLTNARSQHMMSALPLRVDQLQRCTFFQKVAEADLQLVCAAARPRVAFERDVLCTQGSTVPEMLIVCRGALSVLLADPNAASGVTAAAAGGHPPLSPTSGAPPVALRSHSISPSSGLPHANQRALSSSAASTALPHSRAAAQQCMTLDAGMDFGGDHLIFEDRASVWVQCPAHTTTEYWCISSAALHGALKNTTQRKLMADAAAQSRAAFMRRSMSAATLRGLWLQYLPVLRRLEQAVLLSPSSAELQPQLEQVFRDLLAASNAVVWKPGDRLVNVGDEIASAVLLQSGRLHRLVLQGTENNNNNSAKQQQQPLSPRGTSGSDSPVKKFVRKRLGGGGGGAEGSEDDPMRMTAPCILGETFLGRVQRWNASLTAARVCEGWTLHRNDVYRILRQWPELLAVMRSVVQASHNNNSSSNHHHGSSHHHHHHSSSHHHHAATTTTTTAHPQHEQQQMGTKSAVTFASVLPGKGSGGEGPQQQPRPSIFVPNAVSSDHNPHSTPAAAGGGKERQHMSSGVVSPLSLSMLESQSQSQQQQHFSSYHETAPNAATTEEGGGAGGSGGWKPSVPHAPKLRSGGRATIHERRATERKHREDAVVEAALAVTQRRARRLAPPPSDRVPFHSYEGLHPVQPSSVESYHAVRRSAQRQQTSSSASPRRPPHSDHALASSSTVDGGSLQQQQQQQLLLRAASSVARPKTASAALPGSSSITAGGSTTTPTAAATGMNTVSGSTAAPTATTTTTTVREMLQAEVENMTLRQRRKRMAASLLSGANISSSPSVSGGSAAQQLDASTASGGVIGAKAAKAVLKRILSTHKEQVAQRREQCKDALTVAKQTNAFSSLQQPSAPLPRLSPLGELYLQSPKKSANSNSSSSNNNNHKRLPPDAVWHKTVPTSYLSAHAFSDI